MTIETANRLYELRKEKGLSQEELAEKLGVSRQAVSKWERSEASPDTDNLIALARIYGLTLDELIFGENQQENEQEKEEITEESTVDPNDSTTDDTRDGVNKVDIGPGGIFVESEDGDKVHISLKGIKITEGKKTKSKNSGVKIDLSGLKFDPDAFFNDDDNDDDEDEDEDDDEDVVIHDGHFHVEIDNRKRKAKFWYAVPYPIICIIAYMLLGFSGEEWGAWGKSWIIFVTIPLYYSIIDCIVKRKFSHFAYPIFTTFVFLYLGLYHGIWHPSWLVFVTIPAFYPIANAIDKANKRNFESHKIYIK